MTAHKGSNYTKLTAARWTPQNVRENSASVRQICDTFTGLVASGDTVTLVAPPENALLDCMSSVIFVSTMSATAAFDIGSDSGTGTAATCLFSGQTAPTGKRLTLDSAGFFNMEWDGGALLFSFSGSYTATTITIQSQLGYKDMP